ncbi:MAG TPA: histidine--tRNA ligase [Acidimicrobiales bacterium]|nr:histidine--tRNA ligase [Acidimicrobiales bacterium]
MSKKANSFQTPIGTRDIQADAAARRRALSGIFAEEADLAGYGELETPIFEDIGVFQRIGEGTDVVRKEMYEFTDKGDRRMALRPEGTAAVCRSFVQQRPTTPWKVWYQGPFFRYEAPQAGRYRQFEQIGTEVLGSADADVDVEVIALASRVISRVGLSRVLLVINSIGEPEDRRNYVEVLSEYLGGRIGDLDPADRDKVATHPLRVLDSKKAATRSVVDGAPVITDFLSAESRAHFDRVQEGLGALGIPFAIEPRLVRGLDYYSGTTFEFQASALEAAQNTICGGGRYNGLVEQLGGPPTPGIGFAMGVDRLLLACDAEGTFPAPNRNVDVWVVDVTDGASARDLTHLLRASGISADRSFDSRSMRSQMKAADRSGAALAVIIGDQELADDMVAIRRLREISDQILVPRSEMVDRVRSMLPEPT